MFLVAVKDGNCARGAAHNVTLKGRRSLYVSGVCDVISFDENSVIMQTTQGTLSIDGEELRIASFISPGGAKSGDGVNFTADADTGAVADEHTAAGGLLIEGAVNALVYTDDEPQERGGLFGRLRKR